MVLTATEFKTNMGRYLEAVGNEEIIITKNGRKIAELIPVKHTITDSLVGALKGVDLPDDFEEKYKENYRRWVREKKLEDRYGDYL